MRRINANEFTRMKTTAGESMNDTCSILTYTKSQDTLGQEIKTLFSTASNVACGFQYNNPKITYRGAIISLDADAILRLPLSQSININNEITCRGNTYKISGIQNGITVNIIPLTRSDVND